MIKGQGHGVTRDMSRTLFSYENLGSTAREFSRKCETLRCKNNLHNLSTLTH